ncbi:MAG: HAD hydrolase-like protein [Acidimicrobiia bacterium]|nr:HAD hydrolase-like protein [Acidimicrobiia bacterium]
MVGTRSPVLFDLDGTICDSALGITRSVSHAVAALGLPPLGDAELRSFVGPPLRGSFAELGLDHAGVERAIVAYREYYVERGIYENEVYAGMADVLRTLCAQPVPVVLATSKPEVFARQILDHVDLAGCFVEVVGSELDGARSDKHEVIVEAFRRLGGRPDGAVMVGDREHDVVGAQRAGMPCIGVGWGYAVGDELHRAGAVRVVDHPRALADELTRRLDTTTS